MLLALFLVMPTSAQAAVKLNKKAVTLIKSQSATLKISGTKKKAKWSSSKKSVATVTQTGKVTAKKKGATVITAKIGSKKYTCKVTVQSPSISKKSATLQKGKTLTLKLSGTNQKVTWKSSNKNVATVSSKGKVTAKKAGTATITATVLKKKYTCKITVKASSSKTKTYNEGMYKVGKTIPAGQYALFPTQSGLTGYFSINRDSSNSLDSIIANDIFYGNSIVTVRSGEYLKLSFCKAVPIKSAKITLNSDGGMYRVGVDIPAGEYRLKNTDTIGGYYEVDSGDRHTFDQIVTNDNFKGTAYVTVQSGQYLKLSRCKIIK
ncbi:MAG TPA: Ig domain-containing protein [Candidatus Choladousia intestinigallinarum]|nr:Ig domain-containing protein [Candidatus Choladousia intestinigallinarum]